MNWHGQSIAKLSDDDLKAAKADIVGMSEFRQNQLDNKRERHSKFDLTNANPAFEQMKSEIINELAKRNIV